MGGVATWHCSSGANRATRRIDALARQAGAAGVRAVVTGNVLYHASEVRVLQDGIAAAREKCTVGELGYLREVNAHRGLKPPDELVRRFRASPDALQDSIDSACLCTFKLGELGNHYGHNHAVAIRSGTRAGG